MESPWEGLVGGKVLGEEADAVALLKGSKACPGEQTGARRLQRVGRPTWAAVAAVVSAAEGTLGRLWNEMTTRHGDWGRDAVLAVGTRQLGWGLVEAVREIPGLTYHAAAQGVRRFWEGVGQSQEKARFVDSMKAHMSKV